MVTIIGISPLLLISQSNPYLYKEAKQNPKKLGDSAVAEWDLGGKGHILPFSTTESFHSET